VAAPYREGAEALGILPGWTLRRTVLKAAMPGICPGAPIAMAIAAGETAPLLYTAGTSDANPALTLTRSPVGYLTYLVCAFVLTNQSYKSANILPNGPALVMLLIILLGRPVILSRRSAG
jgi:phosphate transport system permease protein